VERAVQFLVAGELGEPERELRIRDDLVPVVPEPRLLEAGAQRILVARADPVAAVQIREANAFGRVLRMQIEGKPDDVGVELAPCLLDRYLAEPAERSDVVAPDEDRMLRHVTSNAAGAYL
jgi:hypothetical protein